MEVLLFLNFGETEDFILINFGEMEFIRIFHLKSVNNGRENL